MNQFQRNSVFTEFLESDCSIKPILAKPIQAPKVQEAPSREELGRWYDALVDLIERESDGDVDHTLELTDLRDKIYAYLY